MNNYEPTYLNDNVIFSNDLSDSYGAQTDRPKI